MSEILRLRDEFNMRKIFAVVLLAAACMGSFAAQASAARQTNWQPKANEYWIRVNKGRMPLFEFVAREYARERHLDEEDFCRKAVSAKTKHDEQWKRRKSFWKHFKRK